MEEQDLFGFGGQQPPQLPLYARPVHSVHPAILDPTAATLVRTPAEWPEVLVFSNWLAHPGLVEFEVEDNEIVLTPTFRSPLIPWVTGHLLNGTWYMFKNIRINQGRHVIGQANGRRLEVSIIFESSGAEPESSTVRILLNAEVTNGPESGFLAELAARINDGEFRNVHPLSTIIQPFFGNFLVAYGREPGDRESSYLLAPVTCTLPISEGSMAAIEDEFAANQPDVVRVYDAHAPPRGAVLLVNPN